MSVQASHDKNSKTRRRRKKKTSAKQPIYRSKPPASETLPFNPVQLYRPGRICKLLDIDKSTLSRWRKRGILPAFTEVGGIEGLTGEQLQKFLEQRSAQQQT